MKQEGYTPTPEDDFVVQDMMTDLEKEASRSREEGYKIGQEEPKFVIEVGTREPKEEESAYAREYTTHVDEKMIESFSGLLDDLERMYKINIKRVKVPLSGTNPASQFLLQLRGDEKKVEEAMSVLHQVLLNQQ